MQPSVLRAARDRTDQCLLNTPIDDLYPCVR